MAFTDPICYIFTSGTTGIYKLIFNNKYSTWLVVILFCLLGLCYYFNGLYFSIIHHFTIDNLLHHSIKSSFTIFSMIFLSIYYILI